MNPKRKITFHAGLVSLRGALSTYEQEQSYLLAGLPLAGALQRQQGSRSWDASGELRLR